MQAKSNFILSLSDASAELPQVGGKGASLARLAAAGLPVPPGFHITTAAYRRFVTENALQEQILAAVSAATPEQPATLEEASNQIGKLFAQSAMPDDIAEAIRQAYAELGAYAKLGEGDAPVAVRSSATAEDLPEMSFAGQQETYLNMRGEAMVLDAVKRCWASLWTARAIGYRARHNIAPQDVSLAVVVQVLVPADAAGILFTANPLTGVRSQVMINAAWGLGEAIVGGHVTPDTVVVDKASGKVVERKISQKDVMTIRTLEGTREEPVPKNRRNKAVLKPAQVAELARIGARIEDLYGQPMDIEWALTPPSPSGRGVGGEGEFAILQARPITALPEAPLEWHLSQPHTIAIRVSFVEFIPDIVPPLFATLAVPIATRETSKMIAKVLGFRGEAGYYFEAVNGYVYSCINTHSVFQYGVRGGLGVSKILRYGKARSEEVRANSHAAANKWRQTDLAALQAAELLDGVRELFYATADYFTVAQSGPIPLATMSESAFGRFYNALVRRESDPAASTFLLGLDSLPLQAERSLFDLAQWAAERGQADLADYVRRTPAQAIWGALQADPVPAPLAGEFAARVGAHLAAFGHVVYDLDFSKPVPADDPAPLLDTLKAYLAGQGGNPQTRLQAQAEQRRCAEQSITRRLDPLRRKWFLKLLRSAQENAPGRENAIADLGLTYPQIRRLLRELGRRLVAGGALGQAVDIYWLEAGEVDALAASLDKDEPLISYAASVEERKASWQRARKVAPPDALPENSWFAKRMAPKKTETNILKGKGASAGRVTAPACVLRGPEDFSKMRPGDVLVAVTTTPAWTPLFAMASAVVTDIGGPLSHSSIVAREYGIPAVMGTGVATRRIQNGQTITVDGTSGEVVLHKSVAEQARPAAIEWKMPNPKGQYMRGSIVDMMPDPISPLFATLAIPAIARVGMKQVLEPLTHSEPILPDDYILTINDYAYMGAAFTPRQWWWVLTRMIPAFPRILRQGLSLWRDEIRPRYVATVAHWQARPLDATPTDELWAGVQEVNDAAMLHLASLLVATTGASAGAELLFTHVYDKMARHEGDPAATTFLMGYDSTPIRAEKSLYDLTEWVRTHPELTAHLLDTPSANLAAQLADSPLPEGEGAGVRDWPDFCQRFQDHLQAYGHIMYDLDFAKALPLDDPTPMLETVKMYLRGEGVNPHERQRTAEEKRMQAVEATLNRLRGLRRWAFRKTLGMAQTMAQVRENALADIGLGYPVLRQMLRELGRRFAQAAVIAQPDDIFWLQADEVQDTVAHLPQAQNLRQDMAQRVAQRQATHEALKRVTPPPMLPPRKRYMGFNMESWTPAAEDSQSGSTLKGVAASAGRITAPARVLHGPEDFGQMRPGDVLVAATTTPAWTPLFAMASAVVTDIGGPLSHGSIVAREYGIPAVMGTGIATRRIKSGQVITVDGGAGTVKLEA